jgi:hypothetical protein
MGDTSGRPPPAGSNFTPGYKGEERVGRLEQPRLAIPDENLPGNGPQRCRKGRLRTGGLHGRSAGDAVPKYGTIDRTMNAIGNWPDPM